MMPGQLKDESPTCGHRLHLTLIGGRLVWMCPLCGVINR